MTSPATSPTPRTTAPMSTRPTIVRRTARCTAATLWVTRTAPIAGGRVALRIGTAWPGGPRRACCCGACAGRCARRAPRRSRGAGRRRCPRGRSRRCRPAAGPVPSTTITRPRTVAPDLVTSACELAAVRRGQQVGGGGRQHLGLGARLRAHLVVDAPADARGQGDLERDDGQQQDVGQGQQQPDAEAHDAASARASSSGAPRRKPTPRIVCR